MSRSVLCVALLALLAAFQLAAAAKYPSCNSGKATLKMTNVDKQPAACTTQGAASFTLPCLLNIQMTVKDCAVEQVSTLEKTDEGFPCFGVVFKGNMTAPNAVKLSATLTQKGIVAASQYCADPKNSVPCTDLATLATTPVTAWREKDVLYIAASPSCTYTYTVPKADADLFAGSNATPTGATKTSRGGAGLVLASSPAANSSGNSTKAPATPTASPAPPKKSGSSTQRASAFAIAALAGLAVVLV